MVVGPLVVPITRLRRSVGSTLPVALSAPLDQALLAPVTPADSRVPENAQAECDFLVASYHGGVTVTGTVAVPWTGVCRRCTEPVEGALAISLKERFCEPPVGTAPEDEEAYLIVEDAIDLAPMVHEAILAELPLAPLCREECLGLCPSCGVDRNEATCGCVPPRDPRWASLDVLRSTP